ncbi:DNA-binding protein [Curtobacterium sp. RRHDQ66]|uniref:DNA-binding protein n=1 Tax=Curtobacterium guangdongense TaxID=3413380 RepID=UPI003BF1F599
MYALTVDQVDSRHGDDRVEGAMRELLGTLDDVVLAPERTAGDEFQLLTSSPETTLDALLRLTRTGGWSIGIGIGDVDEPLPASTRAASGSAFIRARDAVERAKRSPEHLAVEIDPDRRLRGNDVEPILRQTVRLRSRRSPEGWQLADLLAKGVSRPDAAEALGITPQAVAKRFAAADLRDEDVLHAALVRLLADADEPA